MLNTKTYHLFITTIAVLSSLSYALNKIQLSYGNPKNYQIKQSGFSLTQQQPLENLDEMILIGPIQVGSQNQTYHVNFDTGSDYLWLTLQNCRNCSPTSKPFNPQSSLTYTSFLITRTLEYFKGSVTGLAGSDMVGMGGTSARLELTLVSETFQFDSMKTDGLLGLGIIDNTPHLFDVAYNEGQIVSPLYGFKVNHDSAAQKSHFYFNFTQQDFPNLRFVDISDRERWLIPLSNGVNIGQQRYPINTANIDSGTSMIVFSERFQEQMNSEFLDQYCSDKSMREDHQRICYSPNKVNYPNIVVQLANGHEIVLEPEDYIQDYMGKLNVLKISFSSEQNQVILGIPFFYNRFIVFDLGNYANPRIGIQNLPRTSKSFLKNATIAFAFKWLLILVVLCGCGIYTKLRPPSVKEDFSVWIKGVFIKK